MILFSLYWIVLVLVAALAFRTGAVINRRLMRRQIGHSTLPTLVEHTGLHDCGAPWSQWDSVRDVSNKDGRTYKGQDRRCTGCGLVQTRYIKIING